MRYCVGVKRQKNCLFKVYYIYLQKYTDVMNSGSKIREPSSNPNWVCYIKLHANTLLPPSYG